MIKKPESFSAAATCGAAALATLLAAVGASAAKPPKTEPPAAAQQKSDEPLSEQLKESEGVIKPPETVDPEIKKPTPEIDSNMPVIKPPGEPGGDQSVQPK